MTSLTSSTNSQGVRTTSVNQKSPYNKWMIFRDLCISKKAYGLSDRNLSVLHALLSFYPAKELSSQNLIVFPSNSELSIRAHGMPESTLRRHLATLVDVGIISRKDSPNRKRYARKGSQEAAYGFSLELLYTRAHEFRKAAEGDQEASMELKLARENVTLLRQEIYKNIEREGRQGEVASMYEAAVSKLRRRATKAELETIYNELMAIKVSIQETLETNVAADGMSGNECQNERQHIESNSYNYKKKKFAKVNEDIICKIDLDSVLCRFKDISEYALSKIKTWRDLADTASQIKSFLGISQSSYEKSVIRWGREGTSVIVAYVLEKVSSLSSPGAYFQALIKKESLDFNEMITSRR
ncbi:plasmid replication protein RepC [Pseudochrobactrum kiredjianiae]|uniref:Plasmid replication protein RepC n=1 Tax=Pseudochrobactrum kiredjianiae TaxID=386305 RepID=A0ABW3UYD9_9HYPH|nr:plasmid replication protein RepC [Pseudochrobactrum kiredjianiae]MDM7852442.1 plasmid replication protein RepC [Pseudochrobactrum kiredjianiae]